MEIISAIANTAIIAPKAATIPSLLSPDSSLFGAGGEVESSEMIW